MEGSEGEMMRNLFHFSFIFLLVFLQDVHLFHHQLYGASLQKLDGIEMLVSTALKSHLSQRGSIILLIDDNSSIGDVSNKVITKLWKPFGISVFRMGIFENRRRVIEPDDDEINTPIYEVRKASWDPSFVVVTEDPEFLTWFGSSANNGRFLASSTPLVVITSLPDDRLLNLMSHQWTFSMMKALFINITSLSPNLRCNLLVHLPYTPVGPSVSEVGSWSMKTGLSSNEVDLFPPKFMNFHGANFNVTVLDYKPVWYTIKETAPNGTLIERKAGMDYSLLHIIGEKLNFKIYVVPVSSWAECLERIVERKAFVTPAYHAILLDRLERFDYTVGFAYVRISFSMAKPQVTPNWLSLYNPLANEVWASILAVLLMMPVILTLLTRPEYANDSIGNKGVAWTAKMVFGILLAQSQSGKLPSSNGGRVAMVAWLLFAFIVGSGYRGNLTAFLTLPSYPPRVETLQQLVETADLITMESWGRDYKASFKKSGIPVLEKIADLMVVGPSLKDGLRESLTKKQGQFDTRHSLDVAINEHYTNRDGTSKFYIGRETVLPGLSGWPIPHDAPFKTILDWCIQASIEAGLYEKWTQDLLSLTRQETRKKKLEFEQIKIRQGLTTDDVGGSEPGEKTLRALSLGHMQGPMMIYVFGTAIGSIMFLFEVVLNRDK